MFRLGATHQTKDGLMDEQISVRLRPPADDREKKNVSGFWPDPDRQERAGTDGAPCVGTMAQ